MQLLIHLYTGNSRAKTRKIEFSGEINQKPLKNTIFASLCKIGVIGKDNRIVLTVKTGIAK
jgi:hypothetical protein